MSVDGSPRSRGFPPDSDDLPLRVAMKKVATVRPAERPVTREQLDAADEVRVDSVLMPVQSATDLLAAKLLVLNEHYCDFGRLFPHVRALREQVDWSTLHDVVDHNPFARHFLALCDELRITAQS